MGLLVNIFASDNLVYKAEDCALVTIGDAKHGVYNIIPEQADFNKDLREEEHVVVYPGEGASVSFNVTGRGEVSKVGEVVNISAKEATKL